MRERGLKLDNNGIDYTEAKSFPVRERGLKHVKQKYRIGGRKSFPVRERGLKLSPRLTDVKHLAVVPRAGTWIETSIFITNIS